jgi:hypothetical protein
MTRREAQINKREFILVFIFIGVERLSIKKRKYAETAIHAGINRIIVD